MHLIHYHFMLKPKPCVFPNVHNHFHNSIVTIPISFFFTSFAFHWFCVYGKTFAVVCTKIFIEFREFNKIKQKQVIAKIQNFLIEIILLQRQLHTNLDWSRVNSFPGSFTVGPVQVAHIVFWQTFGNGLEIFEPRIFYLHIKIKACVGYFSNFSPNDRP